MPATSSRLAPTRELFDASAPSLYGRADRRDARTPPRASTNSPRSRARCPTCAAPICRRAAIRTLPAQARRLRHSRCPLAAADNRSPRRLLESAMTPALLDVAELSKRFPAGRPSGPIARLRRRFAGGPEQLPLVHAVDDVSFTIGKGETVGLVGESGCGKSTLVRARHAAARSDRRRHQARPARTLAHAAPSALPRDPDRKRIQMVFQDAGDSINPRFTAFDAIADPLRRLRKLSRRRAAPQGRRGGEPLRPAARTAGPLSASALGRPARPRRHRARGRGRARSPGARRADRRARRVGAGGDPAAAAAAQERARHELPVRLA